jgi:hypothetical protein
MPTIKIKPFGGLNTYDSPEDINDNQCQELNNYYYKDGALRVRPGLRIIDNKDVYGGIIDYYPKDGGTILIQKITYDDSTVEEFNGIVCMCRTGIIGITTDEDIIVLDEQTQLGKMIIPVGTYEDTVTSATIDKVEYTKFYVFRSTGILETYPTIVSNQLVYRQKAITPYVPTIYINCAPLGDGDINESRNLINPKVKQQFSTDATSTIYKLHDDGLDNADVIITYFKPSTGNIITGTFTTNTISFDGKTLILERSTGVITITAGGYFESAADANTSNNLTVEYSKTVTGNADKIYNCTKHTFFGDGLQGEETGTRLFISGNQKYSERIFWSGFNKFNYFPVNGNNTAGTADEKITAFGKIFDILVVFKENSVFRVFYSFVNNAVDVTIELISNKYGCDMPGTVQIINNELVWCHSQKGVHILRSANSSVADERLIRPISRNINSILLQETKDSNIKILASSLDIDGYYYLFIGDKAFLWNYDKTPYRMLNTDEEQKELAWFVWTLPEGAFRTFFNFCNTILSADWYYFYKFYSEVFSDNTTGTNIYYADKIKIKNFDLQSVNILKALRQATIEIYHNSETNIQVTFDRKGTNVNVTYAANQPIKRLILNAVPPFLCYQDILTLGIGRQGSIGDFAISDIVLRYDKGREIYG